MNPVPLPPGERDRARSAQSEGRAFRWAISGFGWVARDHFAPALRQAGGVLAGVADPSPAARAAAHALGAEAHADLAPALAQADALYVATPNHLHAAPAIAALRAGIPVLCEKPMAATLADAEAIAAAARGTGTLYGTAFDQRWHPVHRCMAQLIAQGSIGQPTAIRVAYCCWVGPDWTPTADPHVNWRADPDAAGGGAVIDLAPHGLDLAHLLLGEPVADLHIRLQRRVHAYAVEDGGLLSGATPSGVLYSAHVAYNCPEALPRRRLEVIGTEGALVADNSMGQTPGGTLTRICGRMGDATPIPIPARSPFAAQAEAFAAAVRGDPPRHGEGDHAQHGGGAPPQAAHAFSAERDLALTRTLFQAYQVACR